MPFDGDFSEMLRIRRNAAAATAERECGTDDDRIADGVRKRESIFDVRNHVGRDAGLANGFHSVLEKLPVLCFIYGFGRGAEQADIVRFEKTLARKLHTERKSRLPAEARQNAVGLFLFENPV